MDVGATGRVSGSYEGVVSDSAPSILPETRVYVLNASLISSIEECAFVGDGLMASRKTGTDLFSGRERGLIGMKLPNTSVNVCVRCTEGIQCHRRKEKFMPV